MDKFLIASVLAIAMICLLPRRMRLIAATVIGALGWYVERTMLNPLSFEGAVQYLGVALVGAAAGWLLHWILYVEDTPRKPVEEEKAERASENA
jgi:hypothetical protein